MRLRGWVLAAGVVTALVGTPAAPAVAQPPDSWSSVLDGTVWVPGGSTQNPSSTLRIQ